MSGEQEDHNRCFAEGQPVVSALDMETEFAKISAEIAFLSERLRKAQRAYECELYEIGDLLGFVEDRRAVLKAANEGITVGTILRMTRPLRWMGKMRDDLIVKISRISSAYAEGEPWSAYALVQLKNGKWSADPISICPSWGEIETPELQNAAENICKTSPE